MLNHKDRKIEFTGKVVNLKRTRNGFHYVFEIDNKCRVYVLGQKLTVGKEYKIIGELCFLGEYETNLILNANITEIENKPIIIGNSGAGTGINQKLKMIKKFINHNLDLKYLKKDMTIEQLLAFIDNIENKYMPLMNDIEQIVVNKLNK